MKIVLLNEFSQASKNATADAILTEVTAQHGHEYFNVGMLGEDDYRLTYIHLGILSSVLLNSGACDFVVTGCGTGQGALMSLNAFPGVMCGYCIDPSDAYLFLQINNGNALALPFAKGYGWGADLNLRFIFEQAFSSPTGMGYPPERKQSQVDNANILAAMKKDVARPFLEGLKNMDAELLKYALSSPRFQEYFFANSKDTQITEFVRSIIA